MTRGSVDCPPAPAPVVSTGGMGDTSLLLASPRRPVLLPPADSHEDDGGAAADGPIRISSSSRSPTHFRTCQTQERWPHVVAADAAGLAAEAAERAMSCVAAQVGGVRLSCRHGEARAMEGGRKAGGEGMEGG
ncbi:hypothetical protein Vafri_8580 [Volvox africanus]|uniref:Uncharacterized protein n=1 Tax=Volvox africanus TaxID=51714 RepID=A0A8J4B2U3_9CHLO|nr:hypothetical protein Vafri_8580 [Volvox africanus]